jgi:hypothetical protein
MPALERSFGKIITVIAMSARIKIFGGVKHRISVVVLRTHPIQLPRSEDAALNASPLL